MEYKKEKINTALLLAAGIGSRLQPLTNDAPKCLTEVSGVSILERLTLCLRHHGFTGKYYPGNGLAGSLYSAIHCFMFFAYLSLFIYHWRD